MRRFDWSRPAFLIGFVLSTPVENYSNNAYQIQGIKFRQGWETGMDYILSWITITLIVITVASVVVGLRQAKNILAEGDVPSALYDAATIPDYAWTDRVFPVFIASVSLVGAVILLVHMMLAPETHSLFADRETSAEAHQGRDQLGPDCALQRGGADLHAGNGMAARTGFPARPAAKLL